MTYPRLRRSPSQNHLYTGLSPCLFRTSSSKLSKRLSPRLQSWVRSLNKTATHWSYVVLFFFSINTLIDIIFLLSLRFITIYKYEYYLMYSLFSFSFFFLMTFLIIIVHWINSVWEMNIFLVLNLLYTVNTSFCFATACLCGYNKNYKQCLYVRHWSMSLYLLNQLFSGQLMKPMLLFSFTLQIWKLRHKQVECIAQG